MRQQCCTDAGVSLFEFIAFGFHIMLSNHASGLKLSACPVCRITTVNENSSMGANCGMYNVAGVISEGGNTSLTVAGVYDISNMANACVGQAV